MNNESKIIQLQENFWADSWISEEHHDRYCTALRLNSLAELEDLKREADQAFWQEHEN